MPRTICVSRTLLHLFGDGSSTCGIARLFADLHMCAGTQAVCYGDVCVRFLLGTEAEAQQNKAQAYLY
jgi:hypothetical protein